VTVPAVAVEHYHSQQAVAVAAGRQIDALWRQGMGDDFDLAWSRIAAQAFAIVTAAQTSAAAAGIAYVPAVLAAQGLDPAGLAEVDPQRFAGGTSEGMPVERLLGGAPIRAKAQMAVVADTASALLTAGTWLQQVTLDAVRDANRDATAAAMITRPAAHGWVRMLNPPSCKRCVILAGKFFRWNEGFQRHPRCDCRHIPGSESTTDDARVDPYAYFRSLDPKAQDRLFGATDAQAIRDGADIYRVANIRVRGLAKVTGRSGWQARRYGTPSELTVDDIYAAAGDDRAKAVELLRRSGFVTGEQVAGGNILGNVPNDFAAGQMGRGGTRKGATLAYRKAIASGDRDPLEPATQTAAEKRLHSAVLMMRAVDRGSNPFAANSARDPLTPAVRSIVERNYRRQLDQLATAPEQVRTLARLLGIL
jgi:hypothetical protein